MPIAHPIQIGDLFERWTVIAPAQSKSDGKYWLCRCQCGTVRPVAASVLFRLKSRSCGCVRIEAFIERGPHNRIHGESLKTTEWVVWNDMIRRCTNPNDAAFGDYGGRGITVCPEWRSDYRNFLADMGRRPSRSHSLERVDNNRGYEPDNVKWATQYEQARNKRNNHYITWAGETRIIADWAKAKGISAAAILYRLKIGLDVGAALNLRPGAVRGHRRQPA